MTGTETRYRPKDRRERRGSSCRTKHDPTNGKRAGRPNHRTDSPPHKPMKTSTENQRTQIQHNHKGKVNINKMRKPIFLLKSNKITTKSWMSPSSLSHLIIENTSLVHCTLTLILRNTEYKWRSGKTCHLSRVLFIALNKRIKY
jgi:hypothetical protein